MTEPPPAVQGFPFPAFRRSMVCSQIFSILLIYCIIFFLHFVKNKHFFIFL